MAATELQAVAHGADTVQFFQLKQAGVVQRNSIAQLLLTHKELTPEYLKN